MKLYLGIVYKDDKIINHRSLLKVVFNPILRYFGWCIGTPFNQQENKIEGIMRIFKTDRTKSIEWETYILENNMKIIKKRMII